MKFCSVAVGLGEYGNVYVVVFVEDVAYNFVSSSMFVVFAAVENPWFVVVLLWPVRTSSFVCVVW